MHIDAEASTALDELRDKLAVLAAVANCPWECHWQRLQPGVLLLLGEVDATLKVIAESYEPPDRPPPD